MSRAKVQMQSDYAEEIKDISESEKESADKAEKNQKKLSKRSLWGTIGKIAGTYLLPAAIGAIAGPLAGPALLAAQMGGGLAFGGLGSLLSGKKLEDTEVDVTNKGLFASTTRGDLKDQSSDIFKAQTEAGQDIIKNQIKSSITSPLAGAAGKEVLGSALTPMQGPLAEGVDPSMWQRFLSSDFGGSLSSQLTSDFPMYFSGQDDRAYTPGKV